MSIDSSAFDFHSYPLPPPWKAEEANGIKIYVNDRTGKTSSVHPYELALMSRKASKSFANHREQSLDDSSSPSIRAGVPALDESVDKYTPVPSSDKVQTNRRNKDGGSSRGKYYDFRCEWKEFGLQGNTNSYGMLLRYYEENQQIEVKFDGLDAQWQLTYLEGPYGPVDRYDLFIGAKIKIFGRHLTVASANTSACHWISMEAKRLIRRIAFLQEKIETVGAVPVIRREAPSVVRGFKRAASEGHENLRRIFRDVGKLSEQLSSLGLSHFLT